MMMLDIEEIMCELEGGGGGDQAAGGGGGGGSLMPPGFRFHPTDEELITYYLASKVFINDTCSLSASVDIPQVDLNRCEPWELPDVAKMGEREWYFYSMRDRKYPTGLRTNRATGAGYWKATGKDKEVYSSSGSRFGGSGSKGLLGMKKTLVFYKGRAPRGEKTKWVMHEYRLDGDFSCRHTCKDEWVICRIFHKMGEKKHGGIIMNNATNIHGGQSLYHHHHQLQEEQHPPPPSSSPSPTVPLLESTTTPSLSSLLLESHNPATTTLPPPLMMQQHIQNPNFLFQHHPENDLIKSFPTSPSLFPTIVTGCCFQTNDPSPNSNTTNFIINTIPTTTDNKSNTETNASPSPSSLLRSLLLSNQDYFTTTIPQQCKTEAIFSQIDHHPLSHGHHLSRLGHYWGGLDKTNPTDHQITCSSSSSCCQNPIPNFGVDFSVNATVLGFSSSSLAAEGAGTKLAAGGTTTTTSSVAFKKSGFHQMLLDMM